MIVIAAIVASSGAHVSWAPSAAKSKKRMNAPIAAALVAVAMNAVIGVGAPSYTSGVHWWNGATDALNAKPTIVSPRPVSTIALPSTPPESLFSDIAWPIAAKSVEPVAP